MLFERLRVLAARESTIVSIHLDHAKTFRTHISSFYAEGKLESLFAPSFTPTNDDILRVRSKTTGISETRFMIKDITYRVFDVGGQVSVSSVTEEYRLTFGSGLSVGNGHPASKASQPSSSSSHFQTSTRVSWKMSHRCGAFAFQSAMR